MLASAPRVAYLHEPFNIDPEVRICRARFKYWFTYVCEQNEQPYIQPFRDMLRFRPPLIEGIRDARTLKRLAKQFQSYFLFSGYRVGNFRPLVKDPIAVFSTEWLVKAFDFIPVILVRHPAAFAASLKAKGWEHPFSHFLAQPALMQQTLAPFGEEIREFAGQECDIIDQAGLLWKLIHHAIWSYRTNHPEWIVIRHEDLSKDALTGFSWLFDQLELRFTAHSRETIRRHSLTSDQGKMQRGTDKYPFYQRESAGIVDRWKESLSKEEISRVRERVQPISGHFYQDSEW